METKDTSQERILCVYIPRATEILLAFLRFRGAEMTFKVL
jgi:hypothetical protein